MNNIFKGLDKFLTSRIFLRVVAFAIALTLWFYVVGERKAETVKEIISPLEYLNVSSELTQKAQIKEVKIHIAGTKSVLDDLQPESVLCEVDAKALGVGKYRLPVRAILPKGVRLVDIKPAHVEVEFIRYLERVFQVNVNVKDGLPIGLLLESVRMKPQDVVVTGTEKDLALVKGLRISPTLEQLKSGEILNLPVELISSGKADDVISISPQRVKLTAVLAKGLPKKKVLVNVPIVGTPNSDYRLEGVVVQPSSITIEGSAKDIKGIKEISTEPIDITGISEKQVLVVPLRAPDRPGVSIVDGSTVRITVLMGPRLSRRLFTKVPVRIEGNSIYPGWTVVPSTVNVTVEAVSSEINALKRLDARIEAYVDVTNIVSRKLTVPVLVRMPNKKVKVVKIEPSSVTVYARVD